MSEQKRVPFQSLCTTRKEKKGEEPQPSYRFSLTLPESNEQACPEFNYRELLKSAEKKRKKELNKKGDENNPTNGLDPHDDDDEDKLQEMAKRFETKYGTATAGRTKHNRYDDYVDLGAGYDESDSFIDNTDAYDEIVPEEWTTVRGGFYINSGPLEFKTSEGNSVIGNNNNNNNIEDESSESSEDETEEAGSPKRSKKRAISSSDDEETEGAASDPIPKKPKLDDNVDKNLRDPDGVMKKKKKQDLSGLNRPKTAVVRDLLKFKRDLREAEVSDEHQEDKKKVDKTDSSNKPKSLLEKKFDIKRFEKRTGPAAASSNGLDSLKKTDGKKGAGVYDDTIESVVNAARIEDQSSCDSMDSGKSRSIVCSNSDCDEAMDKEESPMPETLSEDMKEIINKLKTHAENSKEGKTKFFNGKINTELFSLEKKLRSRCTATVRLQTYAHLAHFLPCSKPTLVNRAKKLFLQHVEDRAKAPIERLKAAIDRIMPRLMVKYTRDCQKAADGKGIEGPPSDVDSSDGEDSGSKSSEKGKIPQRRFLWTDETKKLVAEIATVRKEYFDILKPKKETAEAFVSAFMETQVQPLWPPGWVRLQDLIKYSNPQAQAKKKSKKHKDGGSVGSSVVGTTAATNNAETGNHERVKTPTNFSKASDNPINFSSASQGAKSTDATNARQSSQTQDKKSGSKSKESSNLGVAKISVVPTAQLMPPKSKSDNKFNPMDLTSSSLSITPVNDYHKSAKTGGDIKELKKEVTDSVSITPCADGMVDGGTGAPGSYQQSSIIPKPIPLKNRILQDSIEVKQEDKTGGDRERDSTQETHHKTDRKEKKEKRGESRHKSHDSKKRKKEHHHKSHEVREVDPLKIEPTSPSIPSSISKEEQEQRQIEETNAATDFISQIINDAAPIPMTEKRKETGSVLDETTGNMVPPSEQENDVQIHEVIRSLKELQDLQEMKYSPSHSPVSVIQKPSKPSTTSMPYVSYQEDYQHLYHKKDDKLRAPKKEDSQW